jgi:hypothetical protein
MVLLNAALDCATPWASLTSIQPSAIRPCRANGLSTRR